MLFSQSADGGCSKFVDKEVKYEMQENMTKFLCNKSKKIIPSKMDNDLIPDCHDNDDEIELFNLLNENKYRNKHRVTIPCKRSFEKRRFS